MTMPLAGNGNRPSPPQPAPGNELVAPVPMNVTVWTLPSTAEPVVGMRVSTPLGGLHFYFTPEEAVQIGNQLRQQGKIAKTGLALPPGVNLGTDDEDDGPALQS